MKNTFLYGGLFNKLLFFARRNQLLKTVTLPKIIRVSVFLMVISFGLSTAPLANENTHVWGEVLIIYKVETTLETIESFERNHELVLVTNFRHINVRHYRLPGWMTVQEAIQKFSSSPIIEIIEPNYYRKLQFVPTDPEYSEQWALHNTGQTVNGETGSADVDIDWPEAMDIFQPNENVIVAVLDSGVALDHPEFPGNIWINTEDNNYDGRDDDGNGYFDDWFGWDFFDNDNIPLDENGHGTLVASIISGALDNGEGGVGVAPYVDIMALRVADDLGSLGALNVSLSNIIGATIYAADNDAKIVNASFSGPNYSSIEYQYMEWLDSQGILVVAAAGNGGSDGRGDSNDQTPRYPASYPSKNIIAVSAIDRSGGLARFSNYGANSVDLAAPGTDIYGADIKRYRTYFENFESGGAGWTVGGTFPRWSLHTNIYSNNTSLTDSDDIYGDPVNYQAYTDTWVTSQHIYIPRDGPLLSFLVYSELTWYNDYLVVEISTDGYTWDPLQYVGPSDNYVVSKKQADLSQYAGSFAQLRFRLITDYIFEADGIYIDDIEITEVGIFDYNGTQYQYNNGTSFSAPLVSGVAALIMSQCPDFSHREVRQIIFDTVDPVTALAGKVSTGGRLNAHSALQVAGTACIESDQDQDGLPDRLESIIGTDPNKVDTDNDGLTDGLEVNTTKTNPLDEDTDNDGLNDGVDSNPLVAAPNQCGGNHVMIDATVYSTGEKYNCRAQSSITTQNSVTVTVGADVLYMAPRLILKPGFKVKVGGIFRAVADSVVAP